MQHVAKSMYGKAMSKKFSYFHLVSGSSHLHDNLIALSFSCGIRVCRLEETVLLLEFLDDIMDVKSVFISVTLPNLSRRY